MPELEDDADEHMARIYALTGEVMQTIWHLLPWDHEPLPLADGRWLKLKPFIEPQQKGGEWVMAFDALIMPSKDSKPCDGGVAHLEFTVKRTGGGGPTLAGVQAGLAAEKTKQQ